MFAFSVAVYIFPLVSLTLLSVRQLTPLRPWASLLMFAAFLWFVLLPVLWLHFLGPTGGQGILGIGPFATMMIVILGFNPVLPLACLILMLRATGWSRSARVRWVSVQIAAFAVFIVGALVSGLGRPLAVLLD